MTSNEIKYSFCIAHYKNLLLLERCVKSIKAFAKNYEIIIVDDSDSTEIWDLLEEKYKCEKSVLLSRNWKNRGVTYTKNRAYILANGKWTLFIDCDDYFDPVLGSKLLEELDNVTIPVALFHCIDETRTIIELGRTVDLKSYANSGTGEEALVTINKSMVIGKPFYGALRGYEGLGIIKILKKQSCDLYLGSTRARFYTNDSDNRLSIGANFKKRLGLIGIGHLKLIMEYWSVLTLKSKICFSAKAALYLVYAKTH